MKPLEGMYQTATKVKVLSPEIHEIEEAEYFSYAGRQYGLRRNGEE